MKLKHILSEAKEATPELKAFMDDFLAGTTQHPFARHLRIWNDSVGFEASIWGGAIDLGAIMSFIEKGKGDASRALKWFTDLADKHGVPIELAVQPIKNAGDQKGKDLNKRQLTAWYKRNGFKSSGGEYMRREPKKHVTEAVMGTIDTVLPIEGPEAEYLKKIAKGLTKVLEDGVELSIYGDRDTRTNEPYFILYVMAPGHKFLNAAKLKRTYTTVKDALDSFPIDVVKYAPVGRGQVTVEFTDAQRAAFLAKHAEKKVTEALNAPAKFFPNAVDMVKKNKIFSSLETDVLYTAMIDDSNAVGELPQKTLLISDLTPTQVAVDADYLKRSGENIFVAQRDGKNFVIDGHNRLAKAIAQGKTKIKCNVLAFPKEEVSLDWFAKQIGAHSLYQLRTPGVYEINW